MANAPTRYALRPVVLLPAKLLRGDTLPFDICDDRKPSSESILFHHSVAFTIGPDRGGFREWEVFAPDGLIDSGNSGVARAGFDQDSFQVAVHAAQMEIDRVLGAMQMADKTMLAR